MLLVLLVQENPEINGVKKTLLMAKFASEHFLPLFPQLVEVGSLHLKFDVNHMAYFGGS